MTGFIQHCFKSALLILLILSASYVTLAQGSFLLVGGGAEKEGGWSDAPYRWAIEQAGNKKVAIISYDAGSDPAWLPNYFIALGAADASNFEIGSAEAASRAGLYEELMAYDFFFFKGGDQQLYYQFYKDSEVERAAIDKFQAGGVMGGTSAGMAIMSSPCFPAENGSVLPSDALSRFQSDLFVLRSDFLPFNTGFLFDTHFTERGRLPRLWSLMARWSLDGHAQVTGIGIDDQTALAIDPQRLTTAFGTGGVYLYSNGTYADGAHQYIADGIQGIHLSHGHQIDLKTMDLVQGPALPTSGIAEGENGNFYVLMSPVENPLSPIFFDSLVQGPRPILLVTGGSRSEAVKLQLALEGEGVAGITILQTLSRFNETEDWALRNTIRDAAQVVFVDVNRDSLNTFVDAGPTGALLYDHLRRDGMHVAFYGKDCELAGGWYASNRLNGSAVAYEGDLQYKAGLRLLSETIVVPNAFEEPEQDFWENNTLAGLYALGDKALRYALYISGESAVKVTPQGTVNMLHARGAFGTVLIRNTSTMAAPFQAQASGSKPRSNYTFDQLQIEVLGITNAQPLGQVIAANLPDYEYETEPTITGIVAPPAGVAVYPNPTYRFLLFEDNVPHGYVLTNLQGGNILSGTSASIDLQACPPGVYILRLTDMSDPPKLILKQ